ncbi:hypothetical protein JOQ06_007580 [Pogonophryne albipinna]|uniref:Uncharacterized protein n=1 Tax=Pogonophryne albipinna TaxID=1090488 RepID=A0AAD6B1D3_9TELE|nr:hypothetical protein JOQ06_007580 [Pogonophryne albipinna]
MNSSKSVNSTAIRAEIKRHESLQSAINRLSKQFERVENPQLRSGLKVFLLSIQASGHEATNGNIPQQPSPWQQDETCCAAYFLSAILQLPSKPLPFRQTEAFYMRS